MKKQLFSAVLALSLLSCSKSESEGPVTDPQLINFGTYAGLSDTRALDKTTFVGTDVINVSAFHHKGGLNGQVFADNFFKNLPVTGAGANTAAPTDWTYDNLRYWPTSADERLSFVASYPKEVPMTVATGVITITDFAPTPAVETQVDLLWAGVPNKVGSESKATKVNFTFKHALSRIVFNAQLRKLPEPTGNNTAITNIELVDLVGKGTYTYGTVGVLASDVPVAPVTRAEVAGVDWPVGAWTLSTAAADVLNYTPFVAPAAPAAVATIDPVQMGESLLLLPQDVSLKNKVFLITYTITPKAGGTASTSTFHLLPRNDWKQNKQYIYNIIFDEKDPIIFTEVVIEDWIDKDTPGTDIPVEPTPAPVV